MLISGIIAAIFAYLCNKVLLKRFGGNSLVAFVPFIEEFAKTTGAILLESSLIGTHLIFGIIEGVYDIITSSKKIGNLAALASIISHTLFGLITFLTYNRSNSIFTGIITAWIFHSAWNWYITKYF